MPHRPGIFQWPVSLSPTFHPLRMAQQHSTTRSHWFSKDDGWPLFDAQVPMVIGSPFVLGGSHKIHPLIPLVVPGLLTSGFRGTVYESNSGLGLSGSAFRRAGGGAETAAPRIGIEGSFGGCWLLHFGVQASFTSQICGGVCRRQVCLLGGWLQRLGSWDPSCARPFGQVLCCSYRLFASQAASISCFSVLRGTPVLSWYRRPVTIDLSSTISRATLFPTVGHPWPKQRYIAKRLKSPLHLQPSHGGLIINDELSSGGREGGLGPLLPASRVGRRGRRWCLSWLLLCGDEARRRSIAGSALGIPIRGDRGGVAVGQFEMGKISIWDCRRSRHRKWCGILESLYNSVPSISKEKEETCFFGGFCRVSWLLDGKGIDSHTTLIFLACP